MPVANDEQPDTQRSIDAPTAAAIFAALGRIEAMCSATAGRVATIAGAVSELEQHREALAALKTQVAEIDRRTRETEPAPPPHLDAE